MRKRMRMMLLLFLWCGRPRLKMELLVQAIEIVKGMS